MQPYVIKESITKLLSPVQFKNMNNLQVVEIPKEELAIYNNLWSKLQLIDIWKKEHK